MNIDFAGRRCSSEEDKDFQMAASSHSGSSSSSTASRTFTSSIPVVLNWNSKRTLPELLAARQLYGREGCPNSLSSRRSGRVNSSLLAHRAAWNPRRLQNMTLAVGPGTPAAVLLNSAALTAYNSSCSSSFSSSSVSSVASSVAEHEVAEATSQIASREGDNDTDDDDDKNQIGEDHEQCDEGPEEERGEARRGRSRWTVRRKNGDDDDDDDDDDSDDDDDDSLIENRTNARDIVESALMDWYGAESSGDDGSSADGLESSQTKSFPRKHVPSMRHGGCINTAAWLDCGWRLSTTGSSISSCTGIETEECPTQLVTSGDDHLVKFWDVTHAMGTVSPLPGGTATITPFSAPIALSRDASIKKWTDYYKKTNSSRISGNILPLATLRTGHHGNVFHVTPLRGRPGQVATCGADGFLRLTELETGFSNVIVGPEFEDDIGGIFPAGLSSLRPGMCFSHHFLNQHTGLLCSERGLRRFDLRLPPREQPRQSLFGGPFRACKACAVWSSNDSSLMEGGDSAYVFVGGSSADVALGDLRIADGSSSRVIQRYRPSGLMVSDHVSVSGLDLSRDKQELLVSYENDQIYTFPAFPSVKSSSGPTVDEIQDLAKSEGNGKALTELAAYGGHLNRFTFLKNARYAGPQDEYICTGSDSGHAWIYEKSTGAVVSFLNADHSTCNGVIPHPTLPVFVTYGIDSTAKLWRACTPVDTDVNDSAVGRYKCYQESEYEMSPCVHKWEEVHQALQMISEETCDKIDVPPDSIPCTNARSQKGRFGRHFMRRDGSGGRQLGNDLHNLPQVLKQNMYSCIRSLVDGDDLPVESDIEALTHRVSVIRLRHQADRLGLPCNHTCPWRLKKSSSWNGADVHASDLIPDASDWFPYDPKTSNSPWVFSKYFNTSEYGDFYRDRYLTELEDCNIPSDGLERQSMDDDVISDDSESKRSPRDRKMLSSSSEDNDEEEEESGSQSALRAVYETMLVLKEGGNVAMHAGKFDMAAYRYDKAIQYGAVAFMAFPVKHLAFAKDRAEKQVLSWGPTLKLLIITRLNLALLMLKPHFSQPDQTVEQAQLAIHELKPFCSKKGKVMCDGIVNFTDEPEETFVEATALQAKAFSRLGSAQYELGENEVAIQSFEQSIKCTQLASSKPDGLVIRRLNEAKRESRRRNNKRRKKFKFEFSGKES